MRCDPHALSHCLGMFNRLSEYIDQEIDETQRREIETHLAGCQACVACLQSLKQTIALCRQAGRQPIPEMFAQKLQTMIQGMQRPR
jgi:anti-sigma factor RsiW